MLVYTQIWWKWSILIDGFSIRFNEKTITLYIVLLIIIIIIIIIIVVVVVIIIFIILLITIIVTITFVSAFILRLHRFAIDSLLHDDVCVKSVFWLRFLICRRIDAPRSPVANPDKRRYELILSVSKSQWAEAPGWPVRVGDLSVVIWCLPAHVRGRRPRGGQEGGGMSPTFWRGHHVFCSPLLLMSRDGLSSDVRGLLCFIALFSNVNIMTTRLIIEN